MPNKMCLGKHASFPTLVLIKFNFKNILVIFVALTQKKKIMKMIKLLLLFCFPQKLHPCWARAFPFSVLLFKSLFFQFSFLFFPCWMQNPESRCHLDKPFSDMISMKLCKNLWHKLMICIILDY